MSRPTKPNDNEEERAAVHICVVGLPLDYNLKKEPLPVSSEVFMDLVRQDLTKKPRTRLD